MRPRYINADFIPLAHLFNFMRIDNELQGVFIKNLHYNKPQARKSNALVTLIKDKKTKT